MNNKIQLTNYGASYKKWENLAIFAVIIFYLFQTIFFPIKGSICQEYAFDYCAFWSAGKLSRENNLEDIYDLELLKQIQKEIYLNEPATSIYFAGAPFAYLPIFIIPFELLSRMNLYFSFLLWTFINLIGLILYLRFFTRKLFDCALPNKLLLIFMLPLPVFANFHEGQVNIWLLICAGEFMRALLSKKHIKAGIWLSGWLLKPQLLVLIIPFLLIQEKKKILSVFFTSALVFFLVSLSLVGTEGMLTYIKLLLNFSSGLTSNTISAMMNWRMLGWFITPLISPSFGLMVTIIGSLLTFVALLITLERSKISNSSQIIIILLGIFAATLAATWHSHVHMAVILIPPILYLILKDDFNHKLFSAWVFIPVLMRFASYIIFIAAELGNASINPSGVVRFFTGFPSFVLNLIILGWAIHQFNANKLEAQERVIG